MNCAEFFEHLETLPDARLRGDKLRTVDLKTLQQWQYETASSASPGPVHDEERLRLSCFEGRQVRDGKLHRNAFNALVSLGLSSDRCTLAPAEQSLSRAKAKSARDGIDAWGYVELEAAHLRSLKDTEQNELAIGIYDTAIAASSENDGNESHAEAFMLIKRSNSAPLKSLQADLLDAYSNRLKRWSKSE